MHHLHFRLARILGAVAIGALASAPAAAAEVTLNLGIAVPADSHYGAGARAFGAELARLSNGKFEIVVQASSALGGERDMIEGMQIGSVDMAITSTAPLASFVPDVKLLDLPFLFPDYARARAVLDGPIGRELLDKFPAASLVGLAWGESGFRHLTNNVRAVNRPEDLAGLKVRTMELPLHQAAFRALGAAPTPMAFPQLFAALQQGTVDGQETPIAVITSSRFYEVQRFLTLTGHVYSAAPIMISPTAWDHLPDPEKEWFRQAARVGAQATREYVSRVEAEGVQFLRDHGMTVVTTVDTARFRAAVQPAYDMYIAEHGADMLERIRAATQ